MHTNSMKYEPPTHPYENSSFIKKATFWWLNDIFKLGLRRPIEEKDIYKTLNGHESKQLTDKFSTVWETEKTTMKPNILRVIQKIYIKKILSASLLYTIFDIFSRVVQPLCLGGLVSNLTPATDTTAKGDNSSVDNCYTYYYALGMIGCGFITVMITQPFVLYSTQMGIRLRVTCCSMIYRKVLRQKKSVIFDGFNGKVINLMSNDVAHFDYSMYYVHLLWKGPLELLVFGYIIYLQIGYYGLLGIGFILCFIPIQMWMGRKAAIYRSRNAKRSDERVRVMNEIIQGIQVIKMYAWEKSFATIVDEIRKFELKSIYGTLFVRGMIQVFNIVSKISLFLSLVSYVYSGNTFTAKQVFIITSYVNYLYDSMLHTWPLALTSFAEFYVNIKRIEEFLLTPESRQFKQEENNSETETLLNKDNTGKIERCEDKEARELERLPRPSYLHVNNKHVPKEIVFNNVSALWNAKNTDGKHFGNGIRNLNLTINSMCAIVGSVGSGKTSLLQAILGELEIDCGELMINGKISFASQEPWLFEATIKQNILFTEKYEEERYNRVIYVCALTRDLKSLPFGDNTIVGERGAILSGGQRARVNLARAIYRKADIYLLDDPLSAVDAHVGRHIFEKCIEQFLKDKICVLVTHQLHFLKDVRSIILLDNGTLIANESYDNIQKYYSSMFWMAADKEKEEDVEKIQQIMDEATLETESVDNVKQKENKEQQLIGSVGLNVYIAYFKSIENVFLLVFTACLLIFEQTTSSYLDFFLSRWVKWENDIAKTSALYAQNITSNVSIYNNETTSEQRHQYLFIYTTLVATAVYLAFQRSITLIHTCLRASRGLHNKLFLGIIRAPMYFFNTNSSGRIINRFSKDIGQIDTRLPIILYESIYFMIQSIGAMILVSSTNYWLLLPTFLLAIFLLIFRYIYITAARSVKRVEAITRSPIFAHTNATINGLSTVRAWNAQQVLQDEFDVHQNLNSSAGFIFNATSRALSLWLETACTFYLATTLCIFLIFEKNISAGGVGLAITQIFYLTTLCQWGVKETTELENQMTSVERVVEYTEIQPEPSLETEEKQFKPPETWPSEGSILFKDVSLRYSSEKQTVLHNLNFYIKPKEKIGIVGRTGAGKSSIIQALFRLASNEGIIEIDGIDTSNLGLHDLRKKISIIPQDPILFSGTLHSNLDPFKEKTDEDLWNSLEQVDLKAVVSTQQNGLNCQVSDGGSNFSLGQRQLICLARAILGNNKILILDEATANVDAETDKFVQKTIRQKFSECTVLTIAHRLHTVMDSDRILVMDAGQVVEFDQPFVLLKKPNGFLRQLLSQVEVSTANQLLSIAEQSYKRN